MPYFCLYSFFILFRVHRLIQIFNTKTKSELFWPLISLIFTEEGIRNTSERVWLLRETNPSACMAEAGWLKTWNWRATVGLCEFKSYHLWNGSNPSYWKSPAAFPGLSVSVGLELPLGGRGVENKVQRKTRVVPGKNNGFFPLLKQKSGFPSGAWNLNIFLSSCFVPIGSLFLSP